MKFKFQEGPLGELWLKSLKEDEFFRGAAVHNSVISNSFSRDKPNMLLVELTGLPSMFDELTQFDFTVDLTVYSSDIVHLDQEAKVQYLLGIMKSYY